MQNNWKQQEAFLKMDPRKQGMIISLTNALEGKKLTDALPILTKWKQQVQQENIVFTPEENKLLTEIFSSQLSPAQKQQFEYLKHFIK